MLEELSIQLCPIHGGIGLIERMVITVITKYIYIFVPVIKRKAAIVFTIGANVISCSDRCICTEGFILLQPDIDNARIAGRLILCAGIADDLYGFHRGGLQSLQIVGEGASGQIRRPSVDIYLNSI